MSELKDWIITIGVVILIVASVYAIWIVAIFIAIMVLLLIVKSVITLDKDESDGSQ